MIVDCYTHTWENAYQLGRCVAPIGSRADAAATRGVTGTDSSHHWAAAQPVDATIVLGFKSRYLDAEYMGKVGRGNACR